MWTCQGWGLSRVRNLSNLGLTWSCRLTSDPPVIVEMNSSVEAIEGSQVSLLCGADSNPLPLLTWMRDSTVLREAVTDSLVLVLDEVTPAEDGVYACLAENAYGQDNRTVELNVMCESHPDSGICCRETRGQTSLGGGVEARTGKKKMLQDQVVCSRVSGGKKNVLSPSSSKGPYYDFSGRPRSTCLPAMCTLSIVSRW